MDRFKGIRRLIERYEGEPKKQIEAIKLFIEGSAFSTEAIAIAFQIGNWKSPKSKKEWESIEATPWGVLSGENLYSRYTHFSIKENRLAFYCTPKGAKIYEELLKMFSDDDRITGIIHGEYSERKPIKKKEKE